MSDLIHSVKTCLRKLHGVTNIEVIETHISWVLLTGDVVYKIKKPVNYGFVDFSTLEKRRHFCFEELRLNKRLAPDLYIDVVAITGDNSAVEINGRQPVLDYAVRLRQFAQEDQFDNLLNQHKLQRRHFTNLANIIAEFHRSINPAPPDSKFGEPETIHAAAMENFRHCKKLLLDDEAIGDIEILKEWTEAEFHRIYAALNERKSAGMIRECHGDLHLANICMFKGNITPFDCIEFNPEFRWIDTISEIAFLTMDLISRGRQDLAMEFLNEYLTITGDYSGLNCFRYYLVYRAMVRAKVEIIRASQTTRQQVQLKTSLSNFHHYVALADRFSHEPRPQLIITHGLSGSGKSTVARKLQQHLFAIHLRSDVERKRLFGLRSTDSSQSRLAAGIYKQDATEKTYDRLYQLAAFLIRNHWNVIADATFLKKKYRMRFHELARANQVKFIILNCVAKDAALQQRVKSREHDTKAISEANLAVLQHQKTTSEPLDNHELAYSITIDTESPLDLDALSNTIRMNFL